jgi:hypothetical protein
MRADEPKKNYGIGGLRVWFLLKGERGAVQFCCGFGIYLPHLYLEYAVQHPGSLKPEISGWDVGYHALEPQWEGQSSMGPCDHFGGKPCYYDGSSLRADDWVKDIFVGGKWPEEKLWAMLEAEYIDRFGGDERLEPKNRS